LEQKQTFSDKDNSRKTTLIGVMKMEEKLHLFNLRHLFDHSDQLLAPIIVLPPSPSIPSNKVVSGDRWMGVVVERPLLE